MTAFGNAMGQRKAGQTTADAARAKQEAEQRALEAAKSECRRVLAQMRDADPAVAEKIKKQLIDLMRLYPKLSMDFKASLQAKAREYECFANMRAADAMLNRAMAMAMHHDTAERGKLLGKGREYYRKAMMLGADKEFAIVTERLMNSIAQTSAPDLSRPTKAKPLSSAPRNPHQAKM
ncbi:MAG: hypothetical protein ABT940_13725 [Alphaproteobacteria bacterium]